MYLQAKNPKAELFHTESNARDEDILRPFSRLLLALSADQVPAVVPTKEAKQIAHIHPVLTEPLQQLPMAIKLDESGGDQLSGSTSTFALRDRQASGQPYKLTRRGLLRYIAWQANTSKAFLPKFEMDLHGVMVQDMYLRVQNALLCSLGTTVHCKKRPKYSFEKFNSGPRSRLHTGGTVETSEQPQVSSAMSEISPGTTSREEPSCSKFGQSAPVDMPDLGGILREAETLRQGLEAAIWSRTDKSDQTVLSIGHKDSGRVSALFWKSSLKLCDPSIVACVPWTQPSPRRGDYLYKYRNCCVDTFTTNC